MKIKEEVIKVKEVMKERKWYYLIAYLIGYGVSLIANGIPNRLHLIPIKLWGVICAIGVGNALYYGGQPPHERLVKVLKYVSIIMIIMIIFGWIQKLFLKIGIDIIFLI